jgi:PAS domain S-box-containing protein
MPDDLQALRAVVEGTAAGTGREFFRSLVRHIAEAIGVPYVGVCEFRDPQFGRVLAFWDRDHVMDGLDFDFTTSPAAEVLRGGLAHFPTGVSQRFPRHAFLVERRVDGYMAVPCYDDGGRVLGFLSVFDERPMPAEPRRLYIMRIFAARAAAEFERLRAEQRLHESEAGYRDLFENAPVGYLTVGNDLRILNVNRQVTEMLGYPAAEMVGAVIHSFLPDTPTGRARSEEVQRKRLAGEPVSGWELEMRRKDGRPLWINLWVEGERNTDGSFQPARSILVDITDRVLAERERDRLQQQKLYLQDEIKSVHNFEQIIGRSPALMRVIAQIGQVAPTDSTVLITGETGTGKELIARAVHFSSRRKDKPLIKVNCAALPAGLVESELFGHEKGAFSGAIARRLGRFELADGGTIFLDEIGELPADAQVKLLRVLQEREFDRVGGAAPVRTDVRVIAATNRDLLKEVGEKRFREDLYYRLNVFPVSLPPLRDRREDVPMLVSFLVTKFAQRVGKPITAVGARTMERLRDYPWPGNVRELENVLERAVILATGRILDIASDVLTMPAAARDTAERPGVEDVEADAAAGHVTAGRPQRSLEDVEREYIVSILRQTNWLITGPRGAAKILDINPSTLRNRIKKLGLTKSAS